MKYEFESVNCNICNSNSYEAISDKGKFGLPTNVVICKKCGLCYLNPRWNKDSYLHFYKNDYDQYYRPSIQKSGLTRKSSTNPIEIRIERLNLFPPDVEHVLDIGSGEGKNLIHFKSAYPKSKLYAIEPSLASQTQLKDHGISIIGSDVDTDWNDQHTNKFDVVIMRHVLEHFMDPVKIMKKVRSVLKPSGIVYIAVPNNLNPTQNLEKSWFRNVHTYYFNKYTLEHLNQLVGLETLAMTEGDEFNNGEIYLIAKKGTPCSSCDFSSTHYQEQLTLLNKRLKLESNLSYELIRFIKRIFRKSLAITKNKRH